MSEAAAINSNLCTHCGLPSPDGEEFCCVGCQAVNKTIHDLGLQEYYKYRDIRSVPTTRASPQGSSYAYLDETIEGSNRESSVTLQLDGIHCAGCLWLLERMHLFVPGVVSSRLHFNSGTLSVCFDPSKVHLSAIAHRLDSLGYPVRCLGASDENIGLSRDDRRMLLRIGVATFCAMNSMMMAVSLWQGLWSGIASDYGNLLRWTSLVLTLPAMLYSAMPFWISSLYALRSRTLHIDIPIAISLLGGFIVSTINTVLGREHVYFDSVTALITLLLTGRFLQARALGRARQIAKSAWKVLPQYAVVITEGAATQLPIRQVIKGALVMCKPGERVPVDGVVSQGESSVDSSLITGESAPRALQKGDVARAGDLVIDGEITISSLVQGGASRVDAILEQIDKEGERSSLLSLVDRASGHFVAAILCIALSAGAGWWIAADFYTAMDVFVAILIVTCPCALGVATPAAITVAVGKAAKHGILIRGSDTLERICQSTVVCLDKTGTLTSGAPVVTQFRHINKEISAATVSRLIQELSAVTPHHPVSAAMLKHFSADSPASKPLLSLTQYLPGRGVIGRNDSQQEFRLGSARWCLSEGGEIQPSIQHLIQEISESGASPILLCSKFLHGEFSVVACIGVRDSLLPEANEAVQQLCSMRLRPIILSGDAQSVVDSIGAELQLPHSNGRGGLEPEDKASAIKELQADGEQVLMIGDGFNDAYAMKIANVGVGLRGAIDSLIEVVNVYVVRGGIKAVPDIVKGARRTLRLIKCSLVVSAFYNIVGATLAVFGLITPLWAAILMPISSLSVIMMAIYYPTFDTTRTTSERI